MGRGSDYSPAIAFQRTKTYRGITLFEKLMVHNNPDIDLVSDNEYKKFGQILFIYSQDIEEKPDVNKGS